MITKKLEDKTIIWFEDRNEYIVVAPLVAEILLLLKNGVDKQQITTQLFNQVNIPYQQAANLVSDIEALLPSSMKTLEKELTPVAQPNKNEEVRFYQINNLVFKIGYDTSANASLIHPKFAHLEIQEPATVHHQFEVFSNDKYISFIVDDSLVGIWNLKDVHYFQGKFSMELVQKIHHKKEDQWMGVFHASAVSDGTNAFLLLGDSGNGKSTSLALLQANGYTCLADDFVPIDAPNMYIHSFPAAISIKKKSVETLLPLYPELESAREYNFESLNKTVRFIPPKTTDFHQKHPCRALIFIKYDPKSALHIEKISKLDAFEQLVPDSWISPLAQNAEVFLNWFDQLPCYQLTYSDNDKMISAVKNICTDEL